MNIARALGGLLIGRYLRRSRFGRRRGANVAGGERWGSSLLGLVLSAIAMQKGRGRLARLVALAAASLLTHRGMTGRSSVYRAMRVRSA